VLFNDSKVFLKPGVLGSPFSRWHRLCVPNRKGSHLGQPLPPVNTPVNAPVNTLVNTPPDIAERSFEDRPWSTNNAYPTQPQKYLVFALKKLAADCQGKTKKLAAPVINTGLRPVYCRASSSFTQHTPTPTTTPSSYTCLSTTILPLLHPHNTLPHSHNKPTTTLQHLPRTYTFALPFVAFLPLLSGKAVLLTY